MSASIDILKEVSPDGGLSWQDANVPTGPNVLNGTDPQFRFTVTNNGTTELSDVTVTDNVLGQIIGPISLAKGASSQKVVLGQWASGQQSNTATATGTHGGQTVTDTDSAYWFGAEAPAPSIDVEEQVSPDGGDTWLDADEPTGPDVVAGTDPQFLFTVTNTGNVPLSDVTVTDNFFGPVIGPASLAPGESLNNTILGAWTSGQQFDIADASGTYGGQTVTDSDPAYWFGVEAPAPAIDVVKEVSPDGGVSWFDANEPTGPEVISGTNPQFRFTVTNIGNVTLTDVNVTDNVLGSIIGPITLDPGANSQNTVTGTWAAGQQFNIADASGTYEGQTVNDNDSAYWFGASPSVDVEIEISPDAFITWLDADEPTGPNIEFPGYPWFRFKVTNTGNVTLTDVTVTDDYFGYFGPVIGPVTLAPGETSESAFIYGRDWLPGQQVDFASATGAYNGQTVTDTDPAYWFGTGMPAPAVKVEKEVSPDGGITWFDADEPPGPDVLSGTNPQFRFTVTNTGNDFIYNVTVTDDVLGNVLNSEYLLPGDSANNTVTGVWAPGQQSNTAVANGIGYYYGNTVTDTDSAYWFGVSPSIDVEKLVSVDAGMTFQHADEPPYPVLITPANPMYKFTVKNTGNVSLHSVVLVDTYFGTIINDGTLEPGSLTETILTGTFAEGDHCNTATAAGFYDTEDGTAEVSGSDSACYFGAVPSATIEKFVSVDNGATWQQAKTPPGPLLPSGVIPLFKFVVTNTGNVELNNITVTDPKLGFIGTLGSPLAPNASFEWITS